MQVYKAFFKVILKIIPQLMIYVVIFISLTALANKYSNPVNTNFTETKVNMAFINHDTSSKLVEGLKNYLGKNSNIVNIPDDVKKLQDALFFGQVSYVVKVPEGFTDALMDGKILPLEKTAVPGSTSAMHLDRVINKYLNTVKTYIGNMENISEEQLLSQVDNDLTQKTEVEMKNSVEEISKNDNIAFYFNYMSYSLFSILILGVSTVMLVFNNTDIKKRNLCSPIKLRSMNFQMILGNFSFAVFTWFALIITSFFTYGSYIFTAKGLLLLLNSLLFTFAVLSISYLIGNAIKSKNAMSAAANVVSMGTCFISGVFVPQAFLGKTVLKIASFTPNYWYVKSNNSIAGLDKFTMDKLTPIFLNMLIVVGFAGAALMVTLAVIKQKRMSN